MRKLTSLLLLFLCGMATSWADYEVGKLLTAAEVNAGVEQVCLFINQDQGTHFYITSEGTGSDDFVTTDKTCVFDFVKGPGGVYLRNSNGQFVVNQMGAFALSSDQSQAAIFRATQREDGVGNVVAPSSETVMLTDQGYSQNLNSINISGSRRNTLTFNNGTGVWTCFRVYKVNEAAGSDPVPNGPVTAISDLSNTKQYTVVSDRGSLGSYGGYLASTMTSTTTGYAGTANNFAFLTVEGNTYLYNVTNKAFYSSESTTKYKEVASPEGSVVTLVETDQEGRFSMKFGDNYLNMSANGYDYALVVNSWGGAAGYWDEGNRLLITAVDDFDATEALAAIDAYLHPAASYKIVVVDSETEQEFTVAEGVAAAIGDVISDMPDNLKRDYCNYTVAEPLTVQAGSDNTLFVEADYEGLPFEAGKWYYMTVRSAYAVAGEGTITCQAAMPDASNDAAAWSFSGNPYTGIAVKNRSTGDGYTIGYDAVVVARPGADLYMKSGDTRWIISQNTGGFVLRIPENQSIYLHNRNPKLSTCSVSEWAGVHNDAGSTIALVEIPEPIDPSMYTTPVDATIDMTTGTFTEYNGATLEESLLAKRWVSNESPKIDFYCTGGNNMVGGSLIFNGHDAGNNIGIFAGKTYQITAEKGYVISGYTITGVNMDNASSTITAGSQSHEFTTEESTFDVTLDALAYSTSFDVTGTQFLKLSSFVVHLMKAGSEEPVAETFKEGYYNLFNYATDKILGVDDCNMNTVEMPTEYEATWTAIEDNGDGTFKVSLPVKTTSGQHYMHIGSSNRWSNGDATAITFYEVADPAAETTVATAVESIDLGKTYLMVGVRSGVSGALTNVLYKAGEGNDQRMESVVVEPAEGVITMARNAAAMWTAGALAETTETKGLKNAPVLFRNNDDNKFLSASNPQPETQEFATFAPTVAAGVPDQLSSYVTSEEGTFYVKLLKDGRYAYCGSNGRFSANAAANPLQLFKVANPYAETFEATKVDAFEVSGSAWYLVVGTKNDATYALSSTMYQEGDKSNQRMEGTAVTIAEGKISVAANEALLWRFIPSVVEIPSFDAPFEPTVEPVGPVDPETGIEGTFHATNRVKSIEVGKEYMIYNTAWAAGEYALRYGFVYDNSKIAINGLTVPEEFETDNKAYLWKFEDAGEGKYYIKNVATGLYAGTETTMGETKVAFTIADFVDCPSKGSAGSRSVAGERVDVADITAEDAVVYIFNGEKYWNGQNYYNAGENGFVTYEKAHAYAIYEAEEVKVVNNVEVTFHVFDEAEKEVATFKAEYPEGTVITELPDEYKKDFCDYVAAEPLTVSADEADFFCEVSYNLPFIEGQNYYLQQNGKYVYFDTNRNVCYLAEVDNGDFTSRPMTLEEIEAAEDKVVYQWQISGNPYDGYKLYNVGMSNYVDVRPSGYCVMAAEGYVLDLATRGAGFSFTCDKGTIIDFYGNFAAIANESQITDENATITFVEVPEVLPTFEKAINLVTGKWTKTNGSNLASAWVSNDKPIVNFDCINGNNMIGGSLVFNGNSTDEEHIGLFASTGGINYKVSVEEGYCIKSVTIPGHAMANATITLTSGSESYQFTTEDSQFVLNYPEGVSSASFRLVGSSGAFLETAMVVGLEQLPTEDVTFSIYDEEETHIYTEKYPVLRGAVVTELPEALKRDFTTYTYPVESLTVTKGGHNVFVATAKFAMPIVADGETAYNLKVAGEYAYINDEGAVAHTSALTDETSKLRNYCWTFFGNPYLGISVKNVETEQYLADTETPLGDTWSSYEIALSNDPVYASIEKNGESFQLRYGLQNFLSVRGGEVAIYAYDNASGTESVRIVAEAATPEAPTPEEVDVTVNVVDGEGTVLDTTTIKAMTGDVISEVPAAVKARPLCQYAVAEPLRVTKGENVLNVEVSFDEMPFISVAGQDPNWINITSGEVYVGAIYDSANEQWKATCYNATEEGVSESPLTQWAVYGNPYGFRFLNKQAEAYLSYGAEENGVAPVNVDGEATAENAVWPLAGVNNGNYMLERVIVSSPKLLRMGDEWVNMVTPTELTFVVLGGEPGPGPEPGEDDYVINFDKDQTYMHASRWVSNVALDDQEIAVAESYSRDNLAYNSFFEEGGFTVTPGQTVKPAIGYMAEWMHTYAYVDYNRDGKFTVDPAEITDGVIADGQEIVSFSYFNGYNSAATSVSDGNKTIDMPEFTLPESLAPGFYAMRYKVDWNNVDPAGNPGEGDGTPGTKQHIVTNGGSITDVRLNVHGENVKVTSISNDASSSVALDDNTSLAEAVEVPFGQEIGLRFAPAEGKKVASFSVRHGYFNGDEYVHGVRQYAVEDVDGADVVRNRYYLPLEWCDGDIEISVVFDVDTGIQNINGLSNDDVIYGVDGRRMNQRNILNKGVYVINGKKVLVK